MSAQRLKVGFTPIPNSREWWDAYETLPGVGRLLWFNLHVQARRTEQIIRFRAGTRVLRIGQVVCSLRQLADLCDTTKDRIEGNLARLEDGGFISQEKTQRGRIITLLHYAGCFGTADTDPTLKRGESPKIPDTLSDTLYCPGNPIESIGFERNDSNSQEETDTLSDTNPTLKRGESPKISDTNPTIQEQENKRFVGKELVCCVIPWDEIFGIGYQRETLERQAERFGPERICRAWDLVRSEYEQPTPAVLNAAIENDYQPKEAAKAKPRSDSPQKIIHASWRTGRDLDAEERDRLQADLEVEVIPEEWIFQAQDGDWIAERNTTTGEIRARNRVSGEVIDQDALQARKQLATANGNGRQPA